MTIGNQASDKIDKCVDWVAMTSALNLRNILELVNHTLNHGSFAQKQFIKQGHEPEPILYIFLKTCNELNIEGFQQFLK
jgi:hypothetical protein